jgi:hypothetical protein
MVCALSKSLWSIFFADGELLISEQGPSICAVVDVPGRYLAEHPTSPVLHQWVTDIRDAARKVHNSYAVAVSHPSFDDIT